MKYFDGLLYCQKILIPPLNSSLPKFMNSIRLLVILCCLGVAQHSRAQGFLHTYAPGNSSFVDVVALPDGGFFAAGSVKTDSTLLLVRTDAGGATLWSVQPTFNGARAIAACMTSGGNLAVLAENYSTGGIRQNLVLKLDLSGNILWQTAINNGVYANGLRDIAALPGGDLMMVGNGFDSGFEIRNEAVRIDIDGAVEWQKLFGQLTRNIRRCSLLPNGNLAVAGQGDDLYLATLSTDGDLIWEQNYSESGSQTCLDLTVLSDGNIAVLGTSNGNLSNGASAIQVSLLKVDAQGQKIWIKHHYPFPTPAPNELSVLPVLNSFCQDAEGNFLIPFWGFLDDPLDSPLKFLKLSAEGSALGIFDPHISGNIRRVLASSNAYFVMAGDNNGASANALLLKVDNEGEFLNNRIKGSVFRDLNYDCIKTAGEPGMSDAIVRAKGQTGDVFYQNVKPDGSFEVRVPEGTYSLEIQPVFGPKSAYFICDTPSVTLNGSGLSQSVGELGIQVLAECPLLEVTVGGGMLRRCVQTVYNVNWCNAGNLSAEGAKILFTADSSLQYVSSSLPAQQNGNIYTFELGNVAAGACGTLNIRFVVSCETNVGDVLCVEAHALPDTSCVLPEENWDGSTIEVSGECTGSEIEFKIKNSGQGNMTQIADYVIIEDQIMYLQAPIQLQAGEEVTNIRVPMPEDSCFALRVFPNQTSRLLKPVAVVRNCLNGGNLNLLLSLPSTENELARANVCGAVVSAFDPNEKTAFPAGLGAAHYLERGDEIEYNISFQNTGNDTAFLVVLRDTLSSLLDPATFRPVSSSHPYSWSLSDEGVLRFTFENILLPDSNVDEAGSHGYVRFRIGQRPGLPDGSVIENTAHIYFDFNEPVVTNTWFHTIGRPAVVATVEPPTGSMMEVGIQPNPVAEEAVFVLKSAGTYPLHFVLTDPLGKVIEVRSIDSDTFHFQRRQLPSGIYAWSISDGRAVLSRGRLLLR